MTRSIESAAMLTAMWSKGYKDVLDLLIPFAKYSIAKTTKVNEHINISRTLDVLAKEVAYDSLPHHVLQLLLGRLDSEGVIQKTGRKNYLLKLSLKDDLNSFEAEKRQQKVRRDEIGAKLSEYLNENTFGAKFNSDSAIEALLEFFEVQGLVVARRTGDLELLRKKDNKLQYYIGQFILQEHKRESIYFDYITDMVKGYFISTAIFLHVRNVNRAETAKFNNTVVYLDTGLILNVLGLQTEYQTNATRELVEMLKIQDAKLACFGQTVDEVRGIIHAYRHDLISGRSQSRQGGPTLEGWDERGIKPSQIDVFDAALEAKIEAEGIRIVDKPPIGDINEFPLDANGLQARLSERIAYPKNRNTSLVHDVDCVTNICLLRNGVTSSEIESCGHLFVTPNTSLVREANDFVMEGHRRLVPPLSAESELAAVLWLKNFSYFGDYPKSKLVEHAILAMEPDEELVKAFYEYIDGMEGSKEVSDEEINAIRAGLLRRRDIMRITNGGTNQLDDNMVIKARDLLRERYREDDRVEINEHKRIATQANNKNITIRQNAANAIEKAKQEACSSRYKLLRRLTYAVSGLLGIVFILATITLFQNTDYAIWGWCGVVVCVLDIIFILDLFIGKAKVVNGWLKKWAKLHADKIADKKRDEYRSLLDTEQHQ